MQVLTAIAGLDCAEFNELIRVQWRESNLRLDVTEFKGLIAIVTGACTLARIPLKFNFRKFSVYVNVDGAYSIDSLSVKYENVARLRPFPATKADEALMGDHLKKVVTDLRVVLDQRHATLAAAQASDFIETLQGQEGTQLLLREQKLVRDVKHVVDELTSALVTSKISASNHNAVVFQASKTGEAEREIQTLKGLLAHTTTEVATKVREIEVRDKQV